MKRGEISRTQLTALFWAGVLAPAGELLPGLLLPLTEKGSWLSVALAAPLVLAGGWLMGRLAGTKGVARNLMEKLGPIVGRGIILLYMVWAQVLLTWNLRASARRLLASGDRDGSLWFFLLALAGVLLWIGRGNLGAFARAGQFFLAALLAAALVVLALSVIQARPERLLPISWREGPELARGALDAAGVVGWSLFAAFLLEEVQDRTEKKGWHWVFWGLGGILLLATAQAIILGNLGAGLAAKLENPFFALAKSVGVEGAFQRVESIISSLWIFSDLAMGGVLIFAMRSMAAAALPQKSEVWIPWICVGFAAGASLFLSPGTALEALMSGETISRGNVILGLVLPGVLCLLVKGTDSAKGRSISCEKKGGQGADIGG